MKANSRNNFTQFKVTLVLSCAKHHLFLKRSKAAKINLTELREHGKAKQKLKNLTWFGSRRQPS